jgi:hypothetical protein
MLTEKYSKKILLLTLVHPDFLPPVYAIAQVLRDRGYGIHILTFESFVPSDLDFGNNITLESVGRHYDSSAIERIRLRNQFKKRSLQLAKNNTAAVISFCPFSFHIGIIIKSRFEIPILYHALELSDFRLSTFLRSPLSNYRNLRALQALSKADLIATPSFERSAWLAGRGRLANMPYTIMNTAYLPDSYRGQTPVESYDTFRGLVPPHFLDKKIILYTGAVNADMCILELVRAFELLNDKKSVLVITGIKDTDYCVAIRKALVKSEVADGVELFPHVTRAEMLSLQANAHIGVCITRQSQENVESKMLAPNKVGEYFAKTLLILGIKNDYLRPFETLGFAILSPSTKPADLSNAIKKALAMTDDQDYKIKIRKFVEEFFCMQQQLKPVINFIDQI